jgi:3-(3-hydroxy-phenyl)propionate hydroxylase
MHVPARHASPPHPVLIVGAGPVGLVAALSLAEDGIPVTVLEAAAALPEDLRASTFHPPTLDMLDRFGLSEACIAQGLICRTWQFRDRRDGNVATFDLGVLADATNHPYRVQCEQWRLARMIHARLVAHDLVRFRFETRAEAVAQDADGVDLTVTNAAGERETLRGSFLIGADGTHSLIRRSQGIEFEGMTHEEIFLSLSTPFQFHEAIPDLADIAYISDPEEWLTLLRTRSLWRVLLPIEPAAGEAQLHDLDRIEAKLQGVFPKGTPYELVHRTAYRVHQRVAARYVSGRVVLAGDAAHVNNPLGGMGMNGGVHDAVNLADKLGRIWRGADHALLSVYERQRRKVALDVVQAQTARNHQILSQKDPAVRRRHLDDLRATAADPVRHRDFLMRSSMLQSLRDLEQAA